MLENLFDYKLDNGISFNISKNEVYTQFLMYTFFKWNKSIVIVTPTLNEANQLYTNLKYYLKDKVFIFPDDDFLTKKAIASSPELMYMRMKFLNDNKVNDNKILICHTSSFLKKLPSKSNMNSKKIEVGIKSVIDRDDFINKLINIGYKKDSLVTNTGEFSVRGFVIDIFPIFEEHPVRIEFFDDEVMEIKYFDENSQLSIRNIDTIVLKPIKDEYSSENSNVLSYLDKPLLIYQDYNQITMVERSIIEQINYYNEVNSNFMLSDIMSLNTIFVNTIDNVKSDYDISASSIINYGGDINKFKKDVDAEDSFLCTKDKELINRLNFNKSKIIDVDLLSGFIYNGISYYSKNDLFYHKEQVKYNTGYKMGKKIDSIDKLEIGDYVVHKTSGIGVYMGITTIMKAGVPMDYILIKYKGDDKLYLPVDKVDSLYKYSSKDGARPVIHKLNSIEWQKTKMRIKKKIHDISNELIKIYKNRSISKVEPFMEDTPEQVIFENEFSYEETPDQLKTTMEIKKDLESSKPMDRLLCGDVGYGKTEVIFRAVFKAVMNNKQVMYLCPTTLLSYQQYVSALSRFKNHAVNIALLNRYTTKKETNSILKDLEEGKIDVIFGTHRLLSGDIKFKDLGLLVIDEEQRFGVMHKEKIKEIKNNVHVLSVSATPIPRSLQMSLIGVRDLSLIETAPVNKLPVQTYVISYDPYILRDVILKEKARGGQSFILYNKVNDMSNIVEGFNKLLPEVTIKYAHGKMNKEQMQDIMYEFTMGKFDVLVSTTIIENGIDIPNANTMIVMDADKFGLSQLYQIRGRVGRGDRQAYSYLMYNKEKVLNETAQKRLDAIKEFTELGSGYKIAMRDLSIRGAGDLLGSEQAGFIDSVGVDMYIELINEELSGKEIDEDKKETNLNSVSTHIGNDYSDEDSVIIELHKMIGNIDNINDFNDVYESIKDRFGVVNEELSIYMKQELCEKIIDKIGINVVQNDRLKFAIKLDNNIYNKLNVENLFIETTRISTKFNFAYRGDAIFISLLKEQVEKHYINYVLDLLLYISEQLKK